MNNNWTLIIIGLAMSAISLTSCVLCCRQATTTPSYKSIVKHDSSRDYQYEHYCDSIYKVNPDYYHDVLVETDSFQNYIDEHGEWWNN